MARPISSVSIINITKLPERRSQFAEAATGVRLTRCAATVSGLKLLNNRYLCVSCGKTTGLAEAPKMGVFIKKDHKGGRRRKDGSCTRDSFASAKADGL